MQYFLLLTVGTYLDLSPEMYSTIRVMVTSATARQLQCRLLGFATDVDIEVHDNADGPQQVPSTVLRCLLGKFTKI